MGSQTLKETIFYFKLKKEKEKKTIFDLKFKKKENLKTCMV